MGGKNSIASGLSTLAGILEREKERGVATVALSPDTERILRALPEDFMNSGRRKPATPPQAAATLRPVEKPPLEAMSVTPMPGAPMPGAPMPAPTRKLSIPQVIESERTEAWVRAQLNAIFKAVKNCPDSRSLGTLFETVVFAVGNPQADIMLVGEAPGAEEEKQRKPFVGPAGQKLDQILKAMGVSREDVYITNIVKFRPKKGDGRFQGPSNRPPQHDEMAVSLPYIRAEIDVVRPKVIVALGRTAAEGLLERGGSLASFRSGEHHFEGIPVIVTYHPSYLLRQESESNPEQAMGAKRIVWEDMLRVMDRVGMPVTEKQRNYFL